MQFYNPKTMVLFSKESFDKFINKGESCNKFPYEVNTAANQLRSKKVELPAMCNMFPSISNMDVGN